MQTTGSQAGEVVGSDRGSSEGAAVAALAVPAVAAGGMVKCNSLLQLLEAASGSQEGTLLRVRDLALLGSSMLA